MQKATIGLLAIIAAEPGARLIKTLAKLGVLLAFLLFVGIGAARSGTGITEGIMVIMILSVFILFWPRRRRA